MNISAEDIGKITSNIVKDINDFDNWRWFIPLSAFFIFLVLVGGFGLMYLISLFTKEVIIFIIYGASWFIFMIWFFIIGSELLTLKVWMKTKNPGGLE